MDNHKTCWRIRTRRRGEDVSPGYQISRAAQHSDDDDDGDQLCVSSVPQQLMFPDSELDPVPAASLVTSSEDKQTN